MAWVEMIKVRTAGNKELDADDTLPETVSKLCHAPGLAEIRYLVHGNVPGDRMVILQWETPRPPILGSELSHGLIQELKRFGPVDYSVWVHKEG